MNTITMPSTAALVSRASAFTPSTSAWKMAITYAVLLPLLFFGARGSFSFEYQDLNNGTVGAYGGLAIPSSGSGSLTHTIEMLGIYGLAVLAMLPMWKQILQTGLENKLVFALPILALLSTAWSQEPSRTAAFAILALINTFFAIYLSRRFPPAQQMEIFLLAGTVLAVASLLVVALLPQAGIDHKNAAIGWQGVFPHKNICAIVMVSFLLPALATRFTGSLGQIRRVLYILLVTVLIAGTTSRTGWIAGVLCIFCVYLLNLLRRFRRIERGLVFLSLPLALGGLVWLVVLNAQDLLALLGKNSTLTGRTVIWAAALMSIVKRPLLGFGYSAFWIGFKGEAVNLALATGYAGLGNAENGVLQLWLEIGLVGVAVLFLMLLRTCKNAATCFRADSPGYVIWYISLLFLTLLALVDGDKFMVPHAIEWTMYILADVGLAMEAQRLRVLQTA
jgi:exopolysaccharide production protein ExoQ